MKSSQNDFKSCSVCGDLATGYNFNAITCESCKAFFRRNAPKDKKYHCPFNNQCEITSVTRRFCQRCRLEKCFSVGMKKELIMSEEDKEKKRRKIEANRINKRTRQYVENKIDCNDAEKLFSHSSTQSDLSGDCSMSHSPLSSCSSDSAVSPVDMLDTANKSDLKKKFQGGIYTALSVESIDIVLSKAINVEFTCHSFPVHNSYYGNCQQLSDVECAKLNELIIANKGLLAPIDHEIGKIVGEDIHFKDIINLTAVAIRRLVKMAKRIKAFKNMCQEDQVALLKGGCTEMMILRSVMTYDPDKNSWKIPHSNDQQADIKVDVLKEVQGNIYEEHQQFLKTFDPLWRSDENIMVILSAVALFTPGRSHIVHQDVVKLEQNSYYYLLRRYLESVYKGCEARSIFLKLIEKMGDLHRLNEEHIKVFLNVNPREVEPLLIEIFDLKHH
ncbi:nuclear hormone receptor HR96 [Lycorma delicatula]|uniref:nuclear hormone receptor HR96 n=1 Tax=Lycorma delicatula TaxID=130591 RepID=UPI003F51A8A2